MPTAATRLQVISGSSRFEPRPRAHEAQSTVALVRPALRVPKASYSTLACPPIALAYLGAAVREHGVRVQIVDAVGEAPRRYTSGSDPRFMALGLTDSEIADRIDLGVTLIGVTCMFSESWPLVRRTISVLRERFPKVPIILGGEHPSALPERTLRDAPGVDAIVIGEGEQTLIELIRAIDEGLSLDKVSGLAFLREGALVRTERRARVREIETIPRPAWDLVPLAGYLDNGLAYGIGRQRSLPIMATRGCPYQCTFCSSPQMWTTKWVARPPEDVLDEMEDAIERWGIENFDFYDLTAILQKKWILEFCDGIDRRGLHITWQIPSGTRSEALDRDTLRALARTGVRHIVYAPESGSPAVLKRIKKRISLARMKESIAEAAQAGLSVKCNFIVGFPDETWEEAMETVAFCRELARIGATDVNIGPFCPYPGSELYDQLVLDREINDTTDEYFDMLAMYSDLANTRSWSRYMSHRQVMAARFLGMAEFYGLAFLHAPSRALELPFNVATGRHRTRLDRAVGDMLRRVGDSIRSTVRA